MAHTLRLACLVLGAAFAGEHKPRPPASPPAAAVPAAKPPAALPEILEVPAGTLLSLELVDTLSSAKSKPGDAFRARILEGVWVHQRVVLPPGTTVRGVVTEAVPSGRLTGRARLGLSVSGVDVEGSTYAVTTDTLSYLGDPHAGKNIGGVLAGALQGAVMGMLFGGKGGAVIGAGAGAGAGTLGGILSGKQDVTFEQGARLLFETRQAFSVPVYAAPASPPAEKPSEKPAAPSTTTVKPSS